MKRRLTALVIVFVASAGAAQAREQTLAALPQDVWDVAFLWTEPIQRVAVHVKSSDPVSGVWLGLLDGSVRSMERAADFLLIERQSNPPTTEPGKQFQYSF